MIFLGKEDQNCSMDSSFFVKVPHFKSKSSEVPDEDDVTQALKQITSSSEFQTWSDDVLASIDSKIPKFCEFLDDSILRTRVLLKF